MKKPTDHAKQTDNHSIQRLHAMLTTALSLMLINPAPLTVRDRQ